MYSSFWRAPPHYMENDFPDFCELYAVLYLVITELWNFPSTHGQYWFSHISIQCLLQFAIDKFDDLIPIFVLFRAVFHCQPKHSISFQFQAAVLIL